MQVSYFETGRYYAPSNLPRQWPMPAGAYDREAGLRAFRGMVERSQYAEELGFDWVSVSEHHYSPRILTPSLPIAAAYIASHVHNIKIALLGPIVPQSNPVLLAEEMAMLDTMAEGRLVVGMLRGTIERDDDLRSQPRGIARAHRRGHGADPACLEGTGTLRLAGKAFPLPHRVGVAEAAAAAAAADLCARHQ